MTHVSLMLGVPGSLLPASQPLDRLPSSRSTSSTSSKVVNRSFLLVEARGVSPPLSEPLADRVWDDRMEGKGFLLVTGDVGALRARPSGSDILSERQHRPCEGKADNSERKSDKSCGGRFSLALVVYDT